MNSTSRKQFATAVLLCGLLWTALPARAEVPEPRYPEDLAWRLVTGEDVEKVTRSSEPLGDEENQGGTLLSPGPIPLGDLEPAPNEREYFVETPTQWTMPPWPQLAPAPPSELPPELRQAYQANPQEEEPPTVWGSLEPYSGGAPSARLRPRPIERKAPVPTEIPDPFSLRRYRSHTLGYFQIAIYGGATSFQAEDIYQRLRAAAGDRESLEGIGDSAFLTSVAVADESAPSPAPEEPAQDIPTGGPPFRAIEIYGPARPDLLDAGLLAAASAPAFREIPVDVKPPVEEPPAPAGDEVPAPEPAPKPPAGPRMNVLVAYFRAQGVAVELALDERIGSPQDLIALSLLIQNRLHDEW